MKRPPGTEKLHVHSLRDPVSNCKAANREGPFERGAEMSLTPLSAEWDPGLALSSPSPRK